MYSNIVIFLKKIINFRTEDPSLNWLVTESGSQFFFTREVRKKSRFSLQFSLQEPLKFPKFSDFSEKLFFGKL